MFTMLFISTIRDYDFCETLLVKRTHTLLRSHVKFPFHIAIFLHWLYDGSVKTHLWALKNHKKKAAAWGVLPLSSSQGLCASDPATQCSKKTSYLPTLFCCTYFPKVHVIDTAPVICILWTLILTCFGTRWHEWLLYGIPCLLLPLIQNTGPVVP